MKPFEPALRAREFIQSVHAQGLVLGSAAFAQELGKALGDAEMSGFRRAAAGRKPRRATPGAAASRAQLAERTAATARRGATPAQRAFNRKGG